MSAGVTPSERFVTNLCLHSFMRLWTHPNPKGKKGKELCDCLIVCGRHVVIISVKDNAYRETGDNTGWERWTKAAIEKSNSQIWGAERWLKTVDQVERADGRIISLPERGSREYHRIAVALGAHGQVPLKWGDTGNGFVHVCDECSVGALFLALDTITDFVDFCRASEGLIANAIFPLFAGGGIEDLVAFYISQGRSFNFEDFEHGLPDMLVLHDDLWKGLINSADFKRVQRDLKDSYAWDRLVDHYAEDLVTGGMFDMHSKQVTSNELALVTMALQPRMYRAVLAESLLEFLGNANLNSVARVVQGHADTAFVFMTGSTKDREFRVRELALRCMVVRGRLPGVRTVVGIATDRPGIARTGHSSDIAYIHMPTWREQDERHIRGIQNDLGYFKNVTWGK